MPSPSRLEPYETPPVVPFEEWYYEQPYQLVQGMHVLIAGPTQTGKTTLCRLLVRWRNTVVVFGTKPRDKSLDAYIKDGYVRIYSWPPTRDQIRKATFDDGSVRLILWPKIRELDDVPKFRPVFYNALRHIFREGMWTVVIDEALWMSDRQGLNLGQQIGTFAYSMASSGVSCYFLCQRPANVPPIAWTSVAQAMLYHSGRTDDVRELASLGTYPVLDVAKIVQRLQGRRFLSLPTRAQGDWAITEVPASWV